MVSSKKEFIICKRIACWYLYFQTGLHAVKWFQILPKLMVPFNINHFVTHSSTVLGIAIYTDNFISC